MEYNLFRRNTKKIKVGDIFIGGDSPVSVQSMTNTPSDDFEKTLCQIRGLEDAGCDIVRMAVPDMQAVRTVGRLKEAGLKIPLAADIHFNYRLAVEAAEAGADKIRINPGNIGDESRVKEVVKACKKHGIPIRIGVNSGSLEKTVLEKYGSPTPAALVESAMGHVRLLEKYDFNDIIIAIKSSDVRKMISANRIIASQCDYPLHLGVTEAGTAHPGIIKSAAGIGALLCDGIGDTVRISLTDDPVTEVREGRALIQALGFLSDKSINIISCPTCGRTKINIIGLTKALEKRVQDEVKATKTLTVAVMGCAVNGPGEAREADIGIAGGDGEALLFRQGKIIRKIPEDKILDTLIDEINGIMLEK